MGKSRKLFSILLLLLLCSSVKAEISVSTRLSHLHGRETFSDSALLGLGLNEKYESFGVFARGYLERDFAGPIAEERRVRSSANLDEAWLQYDQGILLARAGRQDINWSRLWLGPSMNIWTGNRWNRLLTDPAEYRLIHPVATRLILGGEAWSIDLVQSYTPAYNQMPQPWAERKERWNTEWGLRSSASSEGWTVSGVFAPKEYYTHGGFQLEYDGQSWHPFVEVGWIGQNSGFRSGGVSFQTGDWTFEPTFTNASTPANWPNENQNIFICSVLHNSDPLDLEIRLYNDFDTKDRFGSLGWTRAIADQWKLNVFVQNYSGEKDRLFEHFQRLTGGYLLGLTLKGTWSFLQ